MSLLYQFLIQPLVLIYNTIFTLLYGLIEDPVLSIVVFSIVINFIVLPIYRKADEMQKTEQEQAKKMKPWIDHIRKAFFGDERFMILSAYYKIERYNPLGVLKEAGPILLQIPFFIAAYRYISTLSVLEGASFGPINDLLKPDGLIKIGGCAINLLPIFMTAINIISGFIYSKGGTLRLKIQIYVTAFVFLVLLYESPSGLVIYWIMNNLFSLCKNVLFSYGLEDKRLLPTVVSIVAILCIPIGMFSGKINTQTDLFVSECILVCAFVNIVIIILHLYHKPMPVVLKHFLSCRDCNSGSSILRVLLPELTLALLFGFYIPSTVLSSSPLEFVDSATGSFQTELLSYSILVYTGLFMVWTTVIILSRDGDKRNILTLMLWCALGITLVNQFIFPANTGTLYTDLSFDGELTFSARNIVFNTICSILICCVMMLLYKKRTILFSISGIISLSLLLLGLANTNSYIEASRQPAGSVFYEEISGKPIMLSKNGKNVVVMMLDRAISGYIPFIFDEIPELKDIFYGFVFYPNTISFGAHTNFGSPGIFGGYDYTPYESNKRDTVSLKDKQNEALKLMPMLFMDSEYHVTVCDPPCANYQEIPDLSIYDELPDIHAYNLSGKFSSRYKTLLKGDPEIRQKHNFLMYSVFRTSPLFLRKYIYDNGRYISVNVNFSNRYTNTMIDEYSVLAFLPDLTEITEDNENYFLMFQNGTPHNPTVLNPPDYAVDNQKGNEVGDYKSRMADGRTLRFDNERQWGHYCINSATYKAVCKWLNYLQDEGVYDNTRIILVADHGYNLRQFDELIHPNGLDIEGLNPMLMVKDFNATEPWTTSYEFMTNADVPSLAMKEIIESPRNPFTGIEVDNSQKKTGPMIVTDSDNWQLQTNNATTFNLGKGHWWSVHDNIFEMSNWKKLEETP